MMKKLLFTTLLLTSLIATAQTGQQEVDPNIQATIPVLNNQVNSSNALFSPLQVTDVTATLAPTGGLVGARWIDSLNEYWTSEWNSAQFYSMDPTGALITSFTIPGVTGIRSITTDGTNVYLGTATTTIHVVNPATKTLLSTININLTSAAAGTESRMCAYDPNLDNGNGGFWIADFSSDIASINMTGNQLSVIPSATHAASIYGGDVDYVSAGGPFLWVTDQSGTAPNRGFIKQLQLPAGTPTGVVYDFNTDALAGTTDLLAGSLFVSDEINTGFHVLAGIFQSTPARQFFMLELTPQTASLTDVAKTSFRISPNPANESFNMIIENPSANQELKIYDITGKLVYSKTLKSLEYNHNIDISSLNSGMYVTQLTSDGSQVNRKLIKR